MFSQNETKCNLLHRKIYYQVRHFANCLHNNIQFNADAKVSAFFVFKTALN